METERLIRQLGGNLLTAAAAWAPGGSLLPSCFCQSLSPALPVEAGSPHGCCAGVLPRTRERHVSLRDIEALCGLLCTADRWCLVRPGVWVLCVLVLNLAGGRAQAPETVVLGMSGRRAGAAFSRDRCDREE